MADEIPVTPAEVVDISAISDPEETKRKEKRKVVFSAIFAGTFLTVLWVVFAYDRFFDLHLARFGLEPRTVSGLAGIFFAPLLHGDLGHITSNSLPLFLLFGGTIYFYRGLAFPVLWRIWLITGILVWIFGRDSIHIGASGLVYGFAAFLAVSGMIRNDIRLLSVSFLTIFLYGGMVWGVLPFFKHISWESHLAGALSGMYCAFVYRKKGPPKPIHPLDLEVPEPEPAEFPFPVEYTEVLQTSETAHHHTGNPGIRIYYRILPKEPADNSQSPEANP